MEEGNYYVIIGSERLGPMSLDTLRNMNINKTTPVWHPGMADWAEAGTLPELACCFAPPSEPCPPYHKVYQDYNAPSYAAGSYEQQQHFGAMPPRPNNYLVWCIIVTILCCLAGGIVSLVYSSKVNSLYDQGDYEGSLKASDTTRTWLIVSAVVGLVSNGAYIAFILFSAFGEMMGNF